MKKLNLTLAMALIAICTSAQIESITSIELGYAKMKTSMYYPKVTKEDRPNLEKTGQYAAIELGVRYKGAKIVTNTYTYVKSAHALKYNPWLAVYDIEASYTYKAFTIGAYHECRHLVRSREGFDFKYNYGEDRIFIKIKL